MSFARAYWLCLWVCTNRWRVLRHCLMIACLVPNCIVRHFEELFVLFEALGFSSTGGTIRVLLGNSVHCFSGLGVLFSDSDSASTALFARKTQTIVPVAHSRDGFCCVGPWSVHPNTVLTASSVIASFGVGLSLLNNLNSWKWVRKWNSLLI